MINSAISDEDKAILTEVASMGIGHASTALASLLDAKINVSVPIIDVISIEDAPKIFLENEKVLGVILKVFGGSKGNMMFLFREEDSKKMSCILNKIDYENKNISEDLEVITIKEIANILTGAYLGALTKFTDVVLLHSIPRSKKGNTTDIFKMIIDDLSDTRIITIKSKLTIGDEVFEIVGFLLLSFREGGFQSLLESIKKKYNQ